MAWKIKRIEITCPGCRNTGTVALNAWRYHGKSRCKKCGHMAHLADVDEVQHVYRGFRSIKIVPKPTP